MEFPPLFGKWSVDKFLQMRENSPVSFSSPRDLVEGVRKRIESVSLETRKDCETLLHEHEEHILSLATSIRTLEVQKTSETMRITSLYDYAIRQRQDQYTMQEEALRLQLMAFAEEKAAASAELKVEKSYIWKGQLEAANIELKEKDQWQKNRVQRVTDYVLGGAARLESFTADAESILSAALNMHTLLRAQKLSSSPELISITDKFQASNSIAEKNILQMEEYRKDILKESEASDEDAKRAKDAAMNESSFREQAASLAFQRKAKALNKEFEKRRSNFEQEIAQLNRAKEGIVEKLKACKAAHIQDVSATCTSVIFQLNALMNHLKCTAKCLRSFSGMASLQTVSSLAEAMFETVKSTSEPSLNPHSTLLPPPVPLFNTSVTEPTSNRHGLCEGASFKATEKENPCQKKVKRKIQGDKNDRRKMADGHTKVLSIRADVNAAQEQEKGRERERENPKHGQGQGGQLASTLEERATPDPPPSTNTEGWWCDFQFQWVFLASKSTGLKLPPQGFLDIPWPIIPPQGMTNFRNGSTRPDKLLDSITEMNVKRFVIESANLSGQTQRMRILRELARYHSDQQTWLAKVKGEEKELVEQGCEVVIRILETLKEEYPST